MTALHPTGEVRRRYAEVLGALERADPATPAPERERIRDQIIALFRDVERAMDELGELRESIRGLVDRYREMFRPPAGSGPAASPRRIDHLGSSTYLERGWNAIAGGDFDRAVRELTRALELAPGTPRAEALLGWALMRVGRTAEACWLLEQLLERDPHNHLALANLGYARMRQGRYAEAIDCLSRVARESADRTAALYARLYLGMVYAERKMYRDAEILLNRAIDFGPNLTEAYWELGRVHYEAGDPVAACAAWRKGATSNRFNPWGERCGMAADRVQAGKPLEFG